MRANRTILIGVAAIAVVTVDINLALAQKKPNPKPAPIAPAEKLDPGWEQIDNRLVFLMVRLANVEAGIDAIDKKVAGKKGQQAARAGEAKKAEKGNEMMDRKGGGPMKWSEFYGITAEKFFYHPTDRNTTHHTTTVLSQQTPQADFQSGEGVPSRQGLPVHQRPPQFDYIYKANRDAQARAEREAQELGQKIDALLARRRKLEAEQTMLWCQIAFRAVSRHDLVKKPLYRFEPQPTEAGTESQEKADALKAAVVFVRTALLIIEVGEQDQGRAFGAIKKAVAEGLERLDDVFLQKHILSGSATDLKTPAGQFVALAKHLDDEAHNLSDSYQVAIEGDQAQDQVRKETFRRLFQESLVNYAQTVLALDEMSVLMARDWKVKTDLETPIVIASLAIPQRAVDPQSKPGQSSVDEPYSSTNVPSTFTTGQEAQEALRDAISNARNKAELKACAERGIHLMIQAFDDRETIDALNLAFYAYRAAQQSEDQGLSKRVVALLSQKAIRTVTASIAANRSWQEVAPIRKGDVVFAISVGTWNTWPDGGQDWVSGPDGTRFRAGQSFPYPDMSQGALVGRIGQKPFLIGSVNIINASHDGALEMCNNDDDRRRDNKGQIRVTLMIFKAAP